MEITELIQTYENNPYGLVCKLDTLNDPIQAVRLYHESNTKSILRPIDNTYLAQYAKLPEIRTVAYNALKHQKTY